jgi:hypothetical protein
MSYTKNRLALKKKIASPSKRVNQQTQTFYKKSFTHGFTLQERSQWRVRLIVACSKEELPMLSGMERLLLFSARPWRYYPRRRDGKMLKKIALIKVFIDDT